MTPFTNHAVAQAFEAYPEDVRLKLLGLRELIFRTAAVTHGVGAIEETLKWGEPAYLTSQSKSGSTVRLGWKRSAPQQVAMYFNCQTTLVETFKTMFPRDFKFEGNRAVVWRTSDEVATEALGFCIAMALTYHHRRR